MDLEKVLNELRGHRERLLIAIASMEQLALGEGRKRRGRPPKWLVEARQERTKNSNRKQ